jgi:hypothetical protein
MTEHDENLCRRCGRCCSAKIIIQDEVVAIPVACRYLDPETRLCTVYERRFEVNPRCLTVEEGIRMRVFPADCPYVADLEDYKGPILNWEDSKYSDVIADEIENESEYEEGEQDSKGGD